MIAWSATKLKFTSGIGALCVAALVGLTSHGALPFWAVLIVAMVPCGIFLFVRPDEMKRSVVVPFQITAAVWYFLSVVIPVGVLLVRGELILGWPVLAAGVVLGGIPCVAVLRGVFARPARTPDAFHL